VSPTAADPAALFWELTVTLAAAAAEGTEAITNRLWELGAVGVVEETAVGQTMLRAFFPPGTQPDPLTETLRNYLTELAALEIPGAAAGLAAAPLPAEPWAEAWRAHFRPVAVGRRLLVCPPWDAPTAPGAEGRIVVLIEPGRAFGTGGHGSTRSCLELLERAVGDGRPSHVLDAGCGSGVLAIAAAQLGVARVDAIDVDPDAVAATVDNARRNGVADRVRGTLTSIDAWVGQAPLVVANLLAAAHLTLAPTLASLVSPRGRLIAGGLLTAEVPAVAGVFAAAGCWLVEVAEDEGWASLLLERGE
jgi:ribosomal protein L11 methyltransferase